MKSHSLDYHRKLPHYLPNDAPYFVTTRLAGSLSPPEVARLKSLRPTVEEARFFHEYDGSLDAIHGRIDYLQRPDIRSLVCERLLELEQKEHLVEFHAFCLMPNHIHLVMDVASSEVPLFEIMRRFKGATARKVNSLLGRTGVHFWQWESYDRVVRQGSLLRVIRYVILNPVRARLVTSWEEWPGTYLAPRYDASLILSPN